ncbi:SCAR-like protein 2 isoform X2 [Magnolia sinica]|uniref:SCAR-like protein 2 isoform X2 n=1 Tax=Magnolia sinica TaxID=86752 RepID=UPI0026594874|nr:SCAR-like protein 2 isoform X2 [Magnolia sinica]
MPLIRFQVRNEFGLGDPKLYGEADSEDPRAILDGVAVSGLIGILRQLGDLAEFAAEVFHDIEEQVTATVARSHKMITRVQRIEAALPSLEKAVMAQTSHIHFAYIAGFGWHPDIQTEQNHLTQSDLPRFIMDSYEECRDPPRLFLLDKFDHSGAGTCLKRYSDPSFFKTAWTNSALMKIEKVQQEKKAHKSKKKGPRQKNGSVRRAVSLSGYCSRMQLGYLDIDGQGIGAEQVSTSDTQAISKFSNRSASLDSKPRSSYLGRVLDVNSYAGTEELQRNAFSPSSNTRMQENETTTSVLLDEQNGGADSSSPHGSMQGQNSHRPSSVSWDEKKEIVKSTSQLCVNIREDRSQDLEPQPVIFDQSKLEQDAVSLANADQEDILFDFENIPASFSSKNQFDEKEIVKPTNQPCGTIPGDQLRDLDPLPVIFDQSKLEQDATSHASADQEDTLFHIKDIPGSFSSKNQFGEAEIVMPTNQPCGTIPEDQLRDLDPLPVIFNQSKLEQDAASHASADQEDTLFHIKDIPSSFSNKNQFGEAEIVMPTNQLSGTIPEDQLRDLDPLPVIFDQSKLEQDAASHARADQEDTLFHIKDIPASFSSKNQFGETEIVMPTSQLCIIIPEEQLQDLDPLPVIFNQSRLEQDAASLTNADQDILFHVKNIPASFSSENQFDETEIVKPTSQLCITIPEDQPQDVDPLPVILDQSKLEQDAASLTNSDQDILVDVENIPASFSSKKQIDETEMVNPTSQLCRTIPEDQCQDLEPLPVLFEQSKSEQDATIANANREDILFTNSDQDILVHVENIPAPFSSERQIDETEMVNPTSQLCRTIPEDQCQHLEPLPVLFEQSKSEQDATIAKANQEDILFTNSDQDILVHVENIPAPFSSERQIDETEMVNPTSQLCRTIPEDQCQHLEPLPVLFEQSKSEQDATIAKANQEDILFTNSDQDILVHVRNIPAPFSSERQIDETEMVNPTSQLCRTIPEDQCQDLEPLPVIFEQSKSEQDSTSPANANQEDILFEVESIPASFSSNSQFDETEIMKPTSELCRPIADNRGQDLDPPPVVFDLSKFEQDAASLINSDQDILFHVENIPASVLSKNQLNETETVEPASQPCRTIPEDRRQDLEPLPLIFNQSKLEQDAANLADADREDTLFHMEEIPVSFFSKNFDEVSSETDNYMDALNTMESDVGTDSECQTKWEVELQPNFKHKGMECGIDEVQKTVAQSLDSSDMESPVASYSSNKVIFPKVSRSVSSESLDHAQPPQVATMASNPICSLDTGLNESPRVIDVTRGSGFESVSSSPSSGSSISDRQVNELTANLFETTGFNESPRVIDVTRGSGFESVSGTPSSGSSISDQQVNKITANLFETRESPEISGLAPIKFWTNGGLLGLEPSKPPVLNVSGVADQDYKRGGKIVTNGLSDPTVLPKLQHDGSDGKSVTLVEPIKCITDNSSSVQKRDGLPDVASPNDLTKLYSNQSVGGTGNLIQPISHTKYSKSCHDKQDDYLPVKRNSQELVRAVSEIRPENLKDSHPLNGCGLTETSVVTPEDELHAISSNDVRSKESVQNNTEILTSVSGIGRRFLANGFWRKASLVRNNSCDPCSIVNSNTMKLQESPRCDEQKGQNVVSKTSHSPDPKEKLELESPEYPFSSKSSYIDCPSPPLEHMKISFHPINGLQTPKLKLEFSDKHQLQGSIGDALLPLFQLLPEAASPLQDMGSESDEGTFYRSSPYLSEDLLSPGSESNSEQWESHETAGSHDHEIYDALRRSSSAASISSPCDLETITHHSINLACEFGSLNAENGIKSIESATPLDLLDFAAVNSLTSQHEGKTGTEVKELPALQYPCEQPPVLPLLEWSITKPTFALLADCEHTMCEASKHPNDILVRESVSQQSKPSAPHCSEESTSSADRSMHDQKKLNRSRELNEAANAKELDEMEGCPHQIRNKTFKGSKVGGDSKNWSDS